MAAVILVLGLIGAGIYTDNVAFYWVAGGLGVLYFLFTLCAQTLVDYLLASCSNAKNEDDWDAINRGLGRKYRGR